jgi:Transcription factor WhiB
MITPSEPLTADPVHAAARPLRRRRRRVQGYMALIDGHSGWLAPLLEHRYGLELPCWSADPDLFFAESPGDVEEAKTLCRSCPVRPQCLTGALQRREPWECGVASSSRGAAWYRRKGPVAGHARSQSRRDRSGCGPLTEGSWFAVTFEVAVSSSTGGGARVRLKARVMLTGNAWVA